MKNLTNVIYFGVECDLDVLLSDSLLVLINKSLTLCVRPQA